jgi:small subunit ribosomal protein S12
MPTFRQLAIKGRVKKRRRCIVAALNGAPQRRGVVMKMGTTTPKKPNSAKRKYAKVGILFSKKVIFAHPPGVGQTFIQEFSTVLVEGGNPPDVPGINYSLIRGIYDFNVPEKYGRKRRRSKFGMYKMPEFLKPRKDVIESIRQEQLQRIKKINK